MAQVEDFAQLGERIRHIRVVRGLSQARLAERIGVDRSALSRIETGERKVSALDLVRVAQALDVTVPDLVTLPDPDALAARTPLDDEAAGSERGRAGAEPEIDAAWRDALQLRGWACSERPKGSLVAPG